jgi:hypothetical protein
MSIPSNVTNALTSLQLQVAKALPLESASRPTIQALQLNAGALVAAIDTALANAATMSGLVPTGATAPTIDTWIAPTAPEDIIADLQAMLVSATDQWNLAVMRGLVGRVASNLDQLGPVPAVQPTRIVVPAPPSPALPPAESGQSFFAKFAKTGLKMFHFNS